MYRRAAACIGKILKGANPDGLPAEYPTPFEFVINRNTAKALGLTIHRRCYRGRTTSWSESLCQSCVRTIGRHRGDRAQFRDASQCQPIAPDSPHTTKI